jgi:hypothetical protein
MYWYPNFLFHCNIPKIQLRAKKKFRLLRGVVVVAIVAGVAVRVLIEICIDDISAVLRAKNMKYWLSFIIWPGLMHLILRILRFCQSRFCQCNRTMCPDTRVSFVLSNLGEFNFFQPFGGGVKSKTVLFNFAKISL